MIDAEVLHAAWNRATSASPEQWSKANPARGQCAVTALVIQDNIGGQLIRTEATLPDGTTESHYATMHEDGVILDYTDKQFPEGTEFGPWEDRAREYVLSFPATVERYQLLSRRVHEAKVLKWMTEGRIEDGEDEDE